MDQGDIVNAELGLNYIDKSLFCSLPACDLTFQLAGRHGVPVLSVTD